MPTSRGRVEDSLCLTIAALTEQRMLAAGQDTPKVLTWTRADTAVAVAIITVETDENRQPRQVQLTFDVEIDGVLANVRQRIPLTSTGLAYGGHRWWFTCPACGRRRGVLVLPPGEQGFACRQCHGLLYASQMGPGRGRAMGQCVAHVGKAAQEIARS
ncbi:MAG: hypothetical protein NTV86_19345 [Planctomycetota bacterium]|nr:hypothetical protein [Planctomycetota bacterium]